MNMATDREALVKRLNDSLAGGGLFNPELAMHERVRDLLIDCRAALTAHGGEQTAEVEVIDPYAMDLVREHGHAMTNSEIVQRFLPKRKLATADTVSVAREIDRAKHRGVLDVWNNCTMITANRRILRIICQDDRIFYSKDWNYGLVVALEQQAVDLHGGVRSMELIAMTEEAYQSIPATLEAAELFAAAKEGK